MKTIRYILLALLSLAILPLWASHQHASQSVLSSGKWIKIAVNENGVYRLTYDQIRGMGLRPEKVRVFGYGGGMLKQNFNKHFIDDLPAVPVYMHKGPDGVFNSGDYILFYAQGVVDWEFNGTYSHTLNPYALKGYYFVTDIDSEAPQVLEPVEALVPYDVTDVETYSEYVLHEKEEINLLDPDMGMEGGGRVFYGEQLTNTNNRLQLTFEFKHKPTAEPIMAHMEAAAKSSQMSQLDLTMNGETKSCYTSGIASSDFYTMATTTILYGEYPANTTTNKQSATFVFNNEEENTRAFLDYIELTAISPLTMVGDQMPFSTAAGYDDLFGGRLLYHLANAKATTQIWDITDRDSIRLIPSTLSHDTLLFVGDNTERVHLYIAVNTTGTDFYTPEIIGQIENQNLHALQDIDMVIIAPEAFVPAAEKIAEVHELTDGIISAVVTDQQVYNEFSSGTPDATAYRRVMKMLYDRGNEGIGTKPRFLLIFGGGTFDNRKLLQFSGVNTLLTYQAKNSTVETGAYTTDDYFGFLDDREGDSDLSGRMDIGVGRLPARTEQEAQLMADKIVRYLTANQYGKWKSRLVFLADDGDSNLHTRVAEAGAEQVRTKNPDFNVMKIYLDAFTQETSASGDRYPMARTKLLNALNSGVLYMNYSGHGDAHSITNERILTSADVEAMTNANMGFWMLATCRFSHFDKGGDRCIAEMALLNPHGGAIGVLSATRTVYASQNEVINRNFCDTLFSHASPFHYNMTIGQASQYAKNKTGNDPNKLAYVLFGDPAIRLDYPTELQVVTEQMQDTLHALTIDTIKGFIMTEEEDTATWFNGKVQVTVLDKMQQMKTMDNDQKDPDKKVIMTFNDYPNTLFNGETDVIDGHFKMPFRVPMDIRYNYGNGRVTFYAYDPVEDAEGVGHYEDFVIGGSSDVVVVDSVGPDIHLYLNSPSFPNGGSTFNEARFYADIQDENGINTSGSGIGHDLLLTIDNEIKQTYIMNDYFVGADNSYTAGQVSFKLPELSEGKHTLSFRAWDLINNSSTATLDFTVVKNLTPVIYNYTVYPNPVSSSGELNIRLDYDRSEYVCLVRLLIYDVAGHIVMEYQQEDANDIHIPLSGTAMTGGVYVYQLSVLAPGTKANIQKGKIIVIN